MPHEEIPADVKEAVRKVTSQPVEAEPDVLQEGCCEEDD